MNDSATTGWTVPELARLLRVSQDKIRAWIKAGELNAINTAGARCGRPRYVVLAHHLDQFERRRRAVAPITPARRRRRVGVVDYYPSVEG
jgi:excisionase family DNA binding protein